MNNTKVRFGLAAIVLVSLALLGTRLLPSSVGPPTDATPTPTPDISGYSMLGAQPEGCQERAGEPQPLPAGPYLVDDPFPLRIGLDVPDGWISWVCRSYVHDFTAANELPGGSGWGLILYVQGGRADVYRDPCARELPDTPTGSSVDDFVDALAQLPGYQVIGPSDATLDGRDGKAITLVAPDFSYTDCGSGPVDSTNNAGRSGHAIFIDSHGSFTLRPGERVQLQVFDVDGVRLLLVIDDYPGTSALEEELGIPPSDDAHQEDLVELNEMLDSIRVY